MKSTVDQSVKTFLTNLVAAKKSMSTYPEGHAMQLSSMEDLKNSLMPLFESKEKLVIRLKDDLLHVAQFKVPPGVVAADELVTEFSERRFLALHFTRNVKTEDIGKLLKIMARPPQEVILAGGFPEEAKKLGIKHIEFEIRKAPVSLDGDIIVNGQRLTKEMLSNLHNPELVKNLLLKLIEIQQDDEEGAVQNDLPLNQTLKNMDRIVTDQLMKGVPSNKVVDALVTPEGLTRFKMVEGQSGLEGELIDDINSVDDVEEKILFLIELMRTSDGMDKYASMSHEFVQQINDLLINGTHSKLISRIFVFMLEERKHKERGDIFNSSMKAIDLERMVDFIFTKMSRQGSFEQVILGTMVRSFGKTVAELVMRRYMDSDDKWEKEVAYNSLIHGSRYTHAVMMEMPLAIFMHNPLPQVNLAISIKEGSEFIEKILSGNESQRERMYWALGKLKSPKVLPWLKRALEEDSPEIRKTGLSQLEHFETDSSVDLLIDFIQVKSKDTKEFVDEICLAINALARLKAQKALPLLQGLAEKRTWFFDGNAKMIKSYARFAISKIVGSA